jgi:MSHA pilin protein MshC
MFNAARQRAFTLIELITTMMLIGILAVVVMPHFADKAGFDAAGFASSLSSALQHARKSAVAMRRNVCVVLTGGNTLTFTRKLAPDTANTFTCDATTLPLAGQSTAVLEAPSGVTISPTAASMAFNALGQPSTGATWTITGSDGSTRTVLIEEDSGYVYTP